MKRLALLVGLALVCVGASAHASMSLRGLMLSFGTGLEQVPVCQ